MHFTIQQDRCAMKVGTDGVLLGAWADVQNVKTVLDIGTGTGLVALMIAQRAPESEIVAIEIDEMAASQAADNFKSSKFRERIQHQHLALQEFEFEGTFDLLICNPPFFPSGTPSPDQKRNVARQEESLDLLTLIQKCSPLMAAHSRLALILPALRKDELVAVIQEHEMYLKRICLVKPNHQKEPKRILFAALKGLHVSGVVEETLVIEEGERHVYTPEFKKLTSEFYPVE
jgi:tRNA1Val (adenine37-N6)-methyltransferase